VNASTWLAAAWQSSLIDFKAARIFQVEIGLEFFKERVWEGGDYSTRLDPFEVSTLFSESFSAP